MAKRELRFAVVIYGGASLAVYMHGVTKELLKLVRASKVLHEIGWDKAADMAYDEGPDQRPHDTEAVYFELLKVINRRGKFRVVVDVIAGASAGAINGIMLAKALLDDAVLDAQTDMWLARADTDQLSGAKHSRWRKWYLFPVLKLLGWWLPGVLRERAETREKLNRFVRQPWLRPPFGAYSDASVLAAYEAGYTTVIWSGSADDWRTGMGADEMCETLLYYAVPGGILYAHTNRAEIVTAVDRFIGEMQAAGYTFVPLSVLMAADPGAWLQPVQD